MTRRGSQLLHSRPDRHETESGQVLPFRRRGETRLAATPGTLVDPDEELHDDLAQFEKDRDEIIDYRQRMLMNVIALAIVTFLVSAGVWIADTIANLERDQDCVLQGRSNCAPIELPPPPQR